MIGSELVQEHGAPVRLVVLTDGGSGPAQQPEAAQEPAVGLVGPRDPALPAPPGPADRVEATVVSDAGASIGTDIVTGLQRRLTEAGPGIEERRIGGHDLAQGLKASVGQCGVQRGPRVGLVRRELGRCDALQR